MASETSILLEIGANTTQFASELDQLKQLTKLAQLTMSKKELALAKKVARERLAIQNKMGKAFIDSMKKQEKFILDMKRRTLVKELSDVEKQQKKIEAAEKKRLKFIEGMKRRTAAREIAEVRKTQKFIEDMKRRTFQRELADIKRLAAARKTPSLPSSSKDKWGGIESIAHAAKTTALYGAMGQALFGVQSALAATIKTTIEFDTYMYQSAGVLQKSVSEGRELTQTVKTLGVTYGQSFGDIQEALLTLGRAGVDSTSGLKDAVKVLSELSLITGDDMREGAVIMSSLLNVFGKEVAFDIRNVGEQLAFVANATKLNIEDFSTISNYALSAADSIGLTKDSFLSLAGAMSKVGVNASTIGTNIRRLQKLTQDDAESNVEFFRVLGASQKDFADALRYNSEAALTSLMNKLKGLSDAKYTKAIKDLPVLLKQSVNVLRSAAKNSFFADMIVGVKGLGDHMEGLEEQAKRMSMGMGVMIDRIKNTLLSMFSEEAEGLFDRIFDRSSAEAFDQSVKDMIKTIQDWAKSTWKAAEAMAGTVAVIAKVAGGVILAITAVKGFNVVMAVATATANLFRISLLSLGAKAGWIGALATGLYLLYDYVAGTNDAAEAVKELTKAQQEQVIKSAAREAQLEAIAKQKKEYEELKKKIVEANLALGRYLGLAKKADQTVVTKLLQKLKLLEQEKKALDDAATDGRRLALEEGIHVAKLKQLMAQQKIDAHLEGWLRTGADVTAEVTKLGKELVKYANEVDALIAQKDKLTVGFDSNELDGGLSEKGLKYQAEANRYQEQLNGTYSKTLELQKKVSDAYMALARAKKANQGSEKGNDAQAKAQAVFNKLELENSKLIKKLNDDITKQYQSQADYQRENESIQKKMVGNLSESDKHQRKINAAHEDTLRAVKDYASVQARLNDAAIKYQAILDDGKDSLEAQKTIQEALTNEAKANVEVSKAQLSEVNAITSASDAVLNKIIQAVRAAKDLRNAFYDVGMAIRNAVRGISVLVGALGGQDASMLGAVDGVSTAKNKYKTELDIQKKIIDTIKEKGSSEESLALLTKANLDVSKAYLGTVEAKKNMLEVSKSITQDNLELDARGLEIANEKNRVSQGALKGAEKIKADGEKSIRAAQITYDLAKATAELNPLDRGAQMDAEEALANIGKERFEMQQKLNAEMDKGSKGSKDTTAKDAAKAARIADKSAKDAIKNSLLLGKIEYQKVKNAMLLKSKGLTPQDEYNWKLKLLGIEKGIAKEELKKARAAVVGPKSQKVALETE
ncbi:MAG: phage tail tape measure protein, partial [Sulfurimonas sp.]|nr:phage tail tape measure protein [Sulfurimonas sp.]